MATTRNAAQGILADDNTETREKIIELLTKAYWMEIETVMSYIANSVNPDGVRAQEIIESLHRGHPGGARPRAAVRRRASRSSTASCRARWTSRAEQTYLQPPEHQTDIVHVIKGVIEAETGAIEHYNRIIEATDGRSTR